MRQQRISGFAILFGLGVASCASSSSDVRSSATDQGSPEEQQAADEVQEHHQHHHHGGVTLFVSLSLDTLGSDPAKRADVEKLQDEIREKLGPARDAEKNLRTLLADGIAAGTIDKTKVDATVADISTAAGAVHDATADALNRLHALLTPVERAELVEKVKAHWAVWRKVNHEAQAGGRERGGRLARLTEQLQLTADQADKIAAALHTAMEGLTGHFDHKEAAAHVEAFGAAFASDTFDAKSLSAAAGPANTHLAAHGANRTAIFFETVTPLLTPEQRTKLAEHLRESLNHQAVSSQ